MGLIEGAGDDNVDTTIISFWDGSSVVESGMSLVTVGGVVDKDGIAEGIEDGDGIVGN